MLSMPTMFTRRIAVGAVLWLAAVLGRAQNQDLPPVETVLKQVRDHSRYEAHYDRAFRTHYAFVRTSTTRQLDSSGKIKQQDTKQSRNQPAVVRASYSLPAKTTTRQPAQNSSGSDSQAFDKSEFTLNDDLLNRFTYTIAKREQLNGRSSLQIDFKPADKKLPARDLKDRFINKTAGSVWVDERDWTITRAQIHLIDSINVVGGLVGAVKKFSYAFDRERTAEGIWYTRNVNWHLEGRELFS